MLTTEQTHRLLEDIQQVALTIELGRKISDERQDDVLSHTFILVKEQMDMLCRDISGMKEYNLKAQKND